MLNKGKFILYILLISILAITLIFAKSYQPKQTLVVWIHGTLFYDAIREKKPINIDVLKYFPFQPLNKKGLIPVDETTNNIPALFSALYKMANNELSNHPNNFYFYTFGWDGKLSEHSRTESAFKLYQSLYEEIAKIKKVKKCEVEVILLTHSHGGNVGLSLAQAEEKLQKNLYIDKLVMFGTPIQSETKKYACSKIFKSIWNIYSSEDLIQIADIFSTQDFFSKRSFKKRNNELLSSKIKEIEIISNKENPTHAELWFLGQVPLLYRKEFPIYPLPISAFTPILLYEKNLPSNDCLVNIQKDGTNCLFNFTDKRTKTVRQISYNLFAKQKNLIDNWFKKKSN